MTGAGTTTGQGATPHGGGVVTEPNTVSAISQSANDCVNIIFSGHTYTGCNASVQQ